MRGFLSKASLVTLFFSSLANVAGAQSIQLSADLSDAPRNIYHSQLTIPVKPGPLTLVYPEWIPGNRPSRRSHCQCYRHKDGSRRADAGVAT